MEDRASPHNLKPLGVTIYDNGPQLFLAECPDGYKYVCYPITEGEELTEHLCVLPERVELEAFLTGRLSLRKLIYLNRDNLYLDVYKKNGGPRAPVPVQFEELADADLPAPSFHYKP